MKWKKRRERLADNVTGLKTTAPRAKKDVGRHEVGRNSGGSSGEGFVGKRVKRTVAFVSLAPNMQKVVQ